MNLKNIKKKSLFILSYDIKCISTLLLFIFLCCSNLQGQAVSFDNSELKFNEVNQIKSITNLNERAATWLIYVYKTTIISPNNIEKKLTVDAKILSDKYPYKAIVISLTEAEINKVQGKHKEAIKKVSEAIQTLESKNLQTNSEKKLLALAYAAFARFSKYAKNKDGLNYGYKSLKLATEINYPIARVFAHNQIGLHISYFQSDHTLALKHFTKAKELLPSLPPNIRNFMSGFILGNIANIWSELGNIEKSIKFKKELLVNKKNHNNIEFLLGTNNNLGTNYYNLKKYDLAEKHLQATLDLMDQHQLYTNQGIPLYRMALIQLEKGNLLKAQTYTEAIDSWLIKHQFIGEYLVDFYQLKSKIAKANSDFEQAIHWLEKAAKEQESINKLVRVNNIVKLEEENKFREIQKERALLKQELSIIQTQKVLLKLVGIITILCLLLFILLYKYNLKFEGIYKLLFPNDKANVLVDDPPKNKVINTEIDKNLKQQISKALKEERLFLSPDLTLRKFSDHLNSNTSYVSKTINEGFGKNYNALINEYRIEEVIQLFQSGEHKTYTIETIYKKAGFKSKSSFQKAFKAKVGVTASYYIEHLSPSP